MPTARPDQSHADEHRRSRSGAWRPVCLANHRATLSRREVSGLCPDHRPRHSIDHGAISSHESEHCGWDGIVCTVPLAEATRYPIGKEAIVCPGLLSRSRITSMGNRVGSENIMTCNVNVNVLTPLQSGNTVGKGKDLSRTAPNAVRCLDVVGCTTCRIRQTHANPTYCRPSGPR